MKVLCPYCGEEAEWCENKRIYGSNRGKSFMCYYCEDCDAYVGCHNNTSTPLGTLANKELRQWRMQVHEVFDPLWKRGQYKRADLYRKLRQDFGKEVHIGATDINACQQIICWVESIKQQPKGAKRL